MPLFDTLKKILLVSLSVFTLIFLIRLIFSQEFAPITTEQIYVIILVLIIVGIVVYLKYRPLTNLVYKPTSYMENMKNMYQFLLDQGANIPVTITHDGKVFGDTDWDVNFQVGDYHYLRYKDPTQKTTRNIFYDLTNKVPIGEIRHSRLNERPEDALRHAVSITETVKKGELPRRALTPTLVREVIERPQEQQIKQEEQQKSK